MAMNRCYRFLFPASIAICLGVVAPGFWARAQERGKVVELGKLKSRVPADWAEQVPYDPNCYKEYRLEPVDEDVEYAHVSLYFLGKGKAATAADCVKHWKGMFLPPEGQRMNDAAEIQRLTVSGAPVTCLDVRGVYKGVPHDPASVRKNYRLLGVYFDTPQGAYVIQLIGSAATVEYYRNAFENWVKAFK
jgi:hypothetical protein